MPASFDWSSDQGRPFSGAGSITENHLNTIFKPQSGDSATMVAARRALETKFLANAEWLNHYGFPMAIKDYGHAVGVRGQRAAFQYWTQDVPWAAAGTVTIVLGGDLAKEAGLISLAAAATAVPTPEPISLSGTGDYLSSPLELQQGVMLLHASHNGSRNFMIKVLPDVGDSYELSVNTIGSYEGTPAHGVHSDSFVGLKPGLHRLEIKADGNWNAEITQHVWTQGDAIPVSTSGRGDGIIGPIMFNAGTIPLKATHNGSANFIIQVFSADGKDRAFIVNEIGEYQGSNAISVQKNGFFSLLSPGVHVVVVKADGEWKVDIGD